MQINVKTLRDALALLGPAVPRNPIIPALAYIQVGNGRAIANSIDVAVVVEVPEAEGSPLCFPRQALDFLERIPGGLMATCEVADGNLTIAVAGQWASFNTVPDVDDFPPIPTLEPEHEGVCDGDVLIRALVSVQPFVSMDDSRPVLTAVCLDLGDHPRAAACDGFRLAWEELPGKLPGMGQLLIPQIAIRHLAHFWKHLRSGVPPPEHTGGLRSLSLVQRYMRLGWKGQQMRFNWGECTIFVRLIEGTYPNYTKLIPETFRAHVQVLAEDLDRALGAVGSIARVNSNIVRLEWEDNRLKVTVAGQDGEKGEIEVTANTEGVGRTALDISHLDAYLAQRQGMVKLSTNHESSPVLVTYHGKANHVLMPMMVQWGTPSPYPQETKPEGDTAGAATAEADMAPDVKVTSGNNGGNSGDSGGSSAAPPDDPVFSEETPVEDIEADMAPTPSDQPPTRAEAAKPRRKSRKAA